MLKPEDFSRIVQVAVEHDGMFFMCMALMNGGWRCGKCTRGQLLKGDKVCRVCKSKVRYDERIDWERYKQAREHIARMEWLKDAQKGSVC